MRAGGLAIVVANS